MGSFSAFFDALVKNVAIPTDVFRKAVAIACLAQGQEESEPSTDLITLALGPEAGRRGERAVRMLLEGDASTLGEALANPGLDRCATRGAVV